MATAAELQAALTAASSRTRPQRAMSFGSVPTHALRSWIPAFKHYATEESYAWHRLRSLPRPLAASLLLTAVAIGALAIAARAADGMPPPLLAAAAAATLVWAVAVFLLGSCGCCGPCAVPRDVGSGDVLAMAFGDGTRRAQAPQAFAARHRGAEQLAAADNATRAAQIAAVSRRRQRLALGRLFTAVNVVFCTAVMVLLTVESVIPYGTEDEVEVSTSMLSTVPWVLLLPVSLGLPFATCAAVSALWATAHCVLVLVMYPVEAELAAPVVLWAVLPGLLVMLYASRVERHERLQWFLSGGTEADADAEVDTIDAQRFSDSQRALKDIAGKLGSGGRGSARVLPLDDDSGGDADSSRDQGNAQLRPLEIPGEDAGASSSVARARAGSIATTDSARVAPLFASRPAVRALGASLRILHESGLSPLHKAVRLLTQLLGRTEDVGAARAIRETLHLLTSATDVHAPNLGEALHAATLRSSTYVDDETADWVQRELQRRVPPPPASSRPTMAHTFSFSTHESMSTYSAHGRSFRIGRDSSNAGPGSSLTDSRGLGAASMLRPATESPVEFSVTEAADDRIQSSLSTVLEWTFDVFELAELTNGRPLEPTAQELFDRFGLCEALELERSVLTALMRKVEKEYCFDVKRPSPYHNSVHAADVLQAVGHFMMVPQLADAIEDLDGLSLLLAAAVHDFRHPGVSSNFLIATGSELAVRYNDESVLENFHAAEAFRVMQNRKYDVLNPLGPEDRKHVRHTVIRLILATDLSQGPQYVGAFRTKVELQAASGAEDERWAESDGDKLLLLQIALKCADVSHAARPTRLHCVWSDLITEEFFRQGDRERADGLPVSPLCDRNDFNMSKSQLGFIEFVVLPCFEPFSSWCDEQRWMNHVKENTAFWKAEHKREPPHGPIRGDSKEYPGSDDHSPHGSSARTSVARGGAGSRKHSGVALLRVAQPVDTPSTDSKGDRTPAVHGDTHTLGSSQSSSKPRRGRGDAREAREARDGGREAAVRRGVRGYGGRPTYHKGVSDVSNSVYSEAGSIATGRLSICSVEEPSMGALGEEIERISASMPARSIVREATAVPPRRDPSHRSPGSLSRDRSGSESEVPPGGIPSAASPSVTIGRASIVARHSSVDTSAPSGAYGRMHSHPSEGLVPSPAQRTSPRGVPLGAHREDRDDRDSVADARRTRSKRHRRR